MATTGPEPAHWDALQPSGAEPVPAPPALDPAIRQMIETAMASNDQAATVKVLAVARQVSPKAGPEIDAMEAAWKARLAAADKRVREERLARLRAATALENWKGEAEFGASRSTGANTNLGILGSLKLEREGLDWTHKLTARADLQDTNGETTAEQIYAGWQPSYRFSEQLYAFGLVQYERDPFAGYNNRYTLGSGLGYRVPAGKRLKLELEGGPALRRIDDIAVGRRTHLAGRGSLHLEWQMTPTLSLTQDTAIYLESGAGNAIANTALDTKLIGALKARFSYNIQYEGNPPAGTQSLNTQSRATFVYSF